MTKVTDGDSPEKAQPLLTVSTLRRRLSTSCARFRKSLNVARSSTKSHAGELMQLAGSVSTFVGVFYLFGTAVGLVVTGLAVVGVGTLHESGRL